MTQRSLATGRRTSWLPPVPLISVKLLELRKRRTLMAVTVAFTVVLPVVFYGVRLLFSPGRSRALRAGRRPGRVRDRGHPDGRVRVHRRGRTRRHRRDG